MHSKSRDRWLRRLLITSLMLAAWLAVPGRALAYPYKLYAKYELPNADGAVKTVTVDIDLKGSTLAPSDPINGSFKGIYLLPKSDPIAQMELNRLDKILFDITCCDASPCEQIATVTVSGEVLHASNPLEFQIFSPRTLASGHPVGSIKIDARPKFTQDYLCDMERQLRQEKGKPIALTPKPAKEAKPETSDMGKAAVSLSIDAMAVDVLRAGKDGPVSSYAYATLFNTGLTTAAGAPIIYSFCRNVHDEIHWDKVAALNTVKDAKPDTEASHSDHKARLVALLKPRIEKDMSAAVEFVKRDGDVRDNVYAHLVHRADFLQDISDLALYETAASAVVPLAGITDKGSQITLSVLSGSRFCSDLSGCNTIIGKSLAATIEYTDKKGTAVKKESALTPDGNGWVIAPNLSDNIGDEITITVSYVAGESRLDLLRRKTKVENIGLITTFPVITEVVAAVTKDAANPTDLTGQSSIPVSWAINLHSKEASHAAVTFPWMIGFNTREAPRLADVIKIFPHVSIIFPLKDGGDVKKAQAAFGGGIALANAFTFSTAVTVQDTPRAFFLVGLSLPDLAKAFVK